MIVLLAADQDDAQRWYGLPGCPDDDVVLIHAADDVRACASMIQPGSRIHVTDRCSPRPGVVSALQALHVRIGLVDPTGLLGNIDRREGARRTDDGRTPPTGAVIAGNRAARGMRRPREIGGA